jgi:hypothetical protein
MMPHMLVVLLILLEDTLTSKTSVMVEKKHKPDFLHQLSHCLHCFDMYSHDNMVACTRRRHPSDPHVWLLLHRVNGNPATFMLVISHLSLFLNAARLFCVAVCGFVRNPYWLDTSIVILAYLVNCNLRNH